MWGGSVISKYYEECRERKKGTVLSWDLTSFWSEYITPMPCRGKESDYPYHAIHKTSLLLFICQSSLVSVRRVHERVHCRVAPVPECCARFMGGVWRM